MTFGRPAVARIGGKAVMIPAAVPGDLLEIEIIAHKRDYATARVVRLIQPGSERREPPCQYAVKCGGCDWQHIQYDAQVRFKAEMLTAEFRRALGIELDPPCLIEPAPAELGYRSRVRLKTGPGGQVGFYQPGTNLLVPIDRCLVAVRSVSAAMELSRTLGRTCSEIEAVAADEGEVLVADLRKAPGPFEVAAAGRMVESGVAGVILRSAIAREVLGNPRIKVEIEPGCTVEADADLFSQVNRAQNLKLVACVMELAQIATAARVLDLFCGTGNFSLPAARRGGHVTGVDSNPLAIAAAKANAARMGLGEVEFVAMAAAEAVRFLTRAGYRPDVVIMDPPRAGAAELIAPLIKLKPQRLVYVSCDHSTLVRDLLALHRADYRLAEVRAFDFFPNTHHIEIVTSLLLT